ncbi:SDR family oxidoreductase [Nostoc sp. UCD121]|uniref:SDR family oxidoreductase n=1 Tax=unclassified Nostoc TaxID=2593658 RepID=UPI0016266FBF|nr:MULTISPECIES: SDR family oxidoreductase [unclassified Nostoc]MBC1222990.1 SDR family oxidoreductase [Nostoc sp. UCD120]MBC1277296.1 SDR family oxidoreductase [Nostoc sp. UCD121]MBC1294027.1 SDR family oxidoreductase [Nostoc sp. UCD122]
MGTLAGKVAIVTGASRGIGQAIAERLAQDGASVVVNYVHSSGKAKEVITGIEARGGQALALQADMSQVNDIRHLFQATVDHFGHLDILVNNAGLAIYKPVVELTEEEFDTTFTLNARGTFFALQEAARRMADNGRIVSISTGGTVSASPTASIYAGSKAAVEQFTKALAKEIGGRGITVNAVSPGFTDTEMLANNPQMKEKGVKMSPLGRLGQPADIADVVAFLVSEEARWLTGQNIQAGGGAI